MQNLWVYSDDTILAMLQDALAYLTGTLDEPDLRESHDDVAIIADALTIEAKYRRTGRTGVVA